MSLKSFIDELDRKYAWSFFGFLLAIIFGSITVYREFIEDKRPTLRYEILTNTSVFDVREQLSNLNILFDGIDIRKQNLSLRVITVRIINYSSKDILKGDYDLNAPLGLRFSTGKILKTEFVTASNHYLRENVTTKIIDDRSLIFPSVILEAREFFSIKVLVLHSENIIPQLSAIGKIAGVPKIPVREAFKDDAKEPFYVTVFQGSVLIQLARLVSYTIGFFVLIAALILPVVVTTSKLDERKRKKAVNEFKGLSTVELNETDEYVFTEFIKFGGHRIEKIHRLIQSPASLAKCFSRYDSEKERRKGHMSEHLADKSADEIDMLRVEIHDRGLWNRDYSFWDIEEYLEAGLIRQSGDGFVPDAHLAATLSHFVRFLRNKKLLGPRLPEAPMPSNAATGKAEGGSK